MGLLDSLFSGQNFSGDGGLLANLLPSLTTVQPSQGFQPVANNHASPLSIGGYQMPRIGAQTAFTPDPAALPQNALPTQGQLPPTPQPNPAFLPQPSAGIGDRLNAGLQNFAYAGGPLQAIAGGLTGLFSGNRTDPAGMARQNQEAQFYNLRDALIQNGETPQAASSKAMAAALSPEAAKTILPELFTSKQEFKVLKDALGGEHGYWIDKLNQKMTPANAGGGAGGSATGEPISGNVGSVLAKGVQQYDPSLSGDAYMAQFSPEVQNAAKAYMKGDVQPTGNPRNQGIETLAKKVAQKYGADMGIPVSDALFAEKRKYRTELGTNSPNSAGGQAKAFNQGISHLSALADNLEKLDNSNGFGIPIIAQGVNAVRQGTSTEQSAISDEAKTLGQTVAGEVGKLFSGSAGGGVHERELTRERFNTVKSKPQLAAALRATLETMDGGLKALEQRRDSVLGPNSGVELVSEETKANIAKIQAAIDRLEGKAPVQAAGGFKEGQTATNPKTGQTITFRNGKWQ